MKVFVIEGTTGEYSDRSTWPVRAYMNEETAKAEVLGLDMRAREVEQGKFGDREDWRWDEIKGAEVRKYMGDPEFAMDYNGTHYSYYEVDVVDLGWPETPQ
jgi:hypothetical protein